MDNYKVTASVLNVREGPSITARVIAHLRQGTEVVHLSTSGDGYWLKVQAGTVCGWCSHKFLQRVEPPTDEEFPWMPIALAELGAREFPGDRDNPRVIEYLHSTSLSAPMNNNDETHWCSAFVNWCVERSGFEGTDSAWARSWLNWGQRITTPRRGCIVVFSRGTVSGHVAFFERQTATTVRVLGGNQQDEVNFSSFPKSRVLGYRVPG